MKKCILLTFLLLLINNGIASAYDFEVGGVYYRINYDSISVMVTYGASYTPGSYSGHVTIPSEVSYNSMTYSVTGIGQNAFRNSSGLTGVDIPNTVTRISDDAFASCTGLTEITLPESLEKLGGGVFMYCSGLTSLFIPANVSDISSHLLYRADNITSIKVDPRNRKYDSRDDCNAIINTSRRFLIQGCNYSTIPEGVIRIDDVAFAYCDKITEVKFPSTLVAIGFEAYRGCTGLTRINLPEGTIQISGQGFRDCTNLKTITFPSTMKDEPASNIGTYCFYSCDSLRDITCFGKKPPIIELYGCFQSNICREATLYVPFDAIETYKTTSYWRSFTHIEAIGDINKDGKLGINDVSNLISQLMADGEQPAYCDLNGDGKVTIADVSALIDMLLNAE